MSDELESTPKKKELSTGTEEDRTPVENDEYEDRERRRCFTGTNPPTPEEDAYELRYGVYRGGFSEVPFDDDERDRHARMHWEAWSSRERPSECYEGIPGYLSGQPISGYKHPDYFALWEKALGEGSARRKEKGNTSDATGEVTRDNYVGVGDIEILRQEESKTEKETREHSDNTRGNDRSSEESVRGNEGLVNGRDESISRGEESSALSDKTSSDTASSEKVRDTDRGDGESHDRQASESTTDLGWADVVVPQEPYTTVNVSKGETSKDSKSSEHYCSLIENEQTWLQLRDELEEACRFFFPRHNTRIREETIESDTELANIFIYTPWEDIRIHAENFANIRKRSKFWIDKYQRVRRTVKKRQRDIEDGDKLSIPEGIRLSEQMFELTENDPIMVALDGVHYMIEVIIQGIRLRSMEKIRQAILGQREDQMPSIKKKRSD